METLNHHFLSFIYFLLKLARCPHPLAATLAANASPARTLLGHLRSCARARSAPDWHSLAALPPNRPAPARSFSSFILLPFICTWPITGRRERDAAIVSAPYRDR